MLGGAAPHSGGGGSHLQYGAKECNGKFVEVYTLWNVKINSLGRQFLLHTSLTTEADSATTDPLNRLEWKLQFPLLRWPYSLPLQNGVIPGNESNSTKLVSKMKIILAQDVHVRLEQWQEHKMLKSALPQWSCDSYLRRHIYDKKQTWLHPQIRFLRRGVWSKHQLRSKMREIQDYSEPTVRALHSKLDMQGK